MRSVVRFDDCRGRNQNNFVRRQHVRIGVGLDARDLIAEGLAVCLGNRERRTDNAGANDNDAAQKVDEISDRRSRAIVP